MQTTRALNSVWSVQGPRCLQRKASTLVERRQALWHAAGPESFDTLNRLDQTILKLWEARQQHDNAGKELLSIATELEQFVGHDILSDVQRKQQANIDTRLVKLCDQLDHPFK